jgi:hypothetical protein
MTSIDIHLPDNLKSYIEAESARRGYKDASAFIAAVLEAERFRNFRDELEQSLVDALKEPSTALTGQDFEEIRREGIALIEKRRQK